MSWNGCAKWYADTVASYFVMILGTREIHLLTTNTRHNDGKSSECCHCVLCCAVCVCCMCDVPYRVKRQMQFSSEWIVVVQRVIPSTMRCPREAAKCKIISNSLHFSIIFRARISFKTAPSATDDDMKPMAVLQCTDSVCVCVLSSLLNRISGAHFMPDKDIG